ncbi:fibrinogen-like protein 1 [Lingula anatina]|uniref:Fibrinogen-like protein 1 n=1 Tax=Lingula anatina TaxID=7574 RepID=A0A1S3IWQ3_LINAN|nr:fibrinogen-like protein 1 [Lingula anatina]XP_013402619.1 fibrinogen-like protein 1 [Lingula anatina]XP_013402620.1 fibrinogen-like protein 1 [Lingula anatina]|eukprot:XP_013402618.1 fibrinogen-like protein 1 [Lingula anatina]
MDASGVRALASLLVLVSHVLAQDMMLYDSTFQSGQAGQLNGKCTCANITNLENAANRRMLTMEQRFTALIMEERRRNENQSEEMRTLSHRLHHLNKQFNTVQDKETKQSAVIKHLRDEMARQQSTMDNLQSDVQRLQALVGNLTSSLGSLKQAPSQTQAHVTPTAKVETTDVPFVPLFPKDCEEVYKNGGLRYPGEYYIMIQPSDTDHAFKACCRITNESGWTVIQRRQDGSVNFFRKWEDYKTGFGDLKGEFWLGNDHIHDLTSQGAYKLRIEMETWEGKSYYAEYDSFSVGAESDLYKLSVKGYHGNAGDSLTSYWENHDGQPFSTVDRDNDDRYYDNCAKHYRGAWWFKSCFESHLNGVYYQKGKHNNYFVRNGVQWNTIHLHSSLKYAIMMVKPNESPSMITNEVQ